MKRAIALLLFTSAAHAAPITPPTGWTSDPTLAAPPAATRFGGATTKVSVYAYRAATGAVLYVNRAEAEVPAADRDRIATLELEEPRNALRRQGANAKAVQDSQRFDSAKQQLEAMVTWRDASLNMTDSSRIVIAGDATKLVAVSGQCVLADDAPPEAAKACEAALATLDTELPAAGRVALSIVATEIEPPPKPAHDVLDDGGKTSLPPIVVNQPAAEPDRRPVYLGMGLVVFAAIFWWNRKRREKFEAENPQVVPRDVPKATAKQKSRDEDADELHAAAEAGDDGETKQ